MLTYRELDEAADRLARLLVGRGVGAGECVALLFSRSVEAVVAMVAVLKCGAAYLPIDPAVPDARVEFMLADAAPMAAITTAELRRGWRGAIWWLSMSGMSGMVGMSGWTANPGPRCRCRAQMRSRI